MRAGAVTNVLMILLRVIVWIAAFVFGQWIAAATGWGPFIWPKFVLWRFLGALLAVVVLMVVLDRFLWAQHRPPGARMFWREFVDAIILGFFFGVAFAL